MSFQSRENIERNANIMSQDQFKTLNKKGHATSYSSRNLNNISYKIKKSKLVGSYHIHFNRFKINSNGDVDYFENRLI